MPLMSYYQTNGKLSVELDSSMDFSFLYRIPHGKKVSQQVFLSLTGLSRSLELRQNMDGFLKGLKSKSMLSSPISSSQALSQQSQAIFAASSSIQAYAQAVLAQDDVTVPINDPTSGQPVDVPTFQSTARTHALTWIDTYHPYMISTQTDIIDFCSNFISFYTFLSQLASTISQPSSQAQFKKGLGLLQNLVSEKQQNVKTSIQNFNIFLTGITTDHVNFQNICVDVTKQYEGQNGKLAQMQTQLDIIQGNINQDALAVGIDAAEFTFGGLMIGLGIVGF